MGIASGTAHTPAVATARETAKGWNEALRSVVIRSFAFFVTSVWIAFSGRSFTHRDRQDR
jgi:hypothetical protein